MPILRQLFYVSRVADGVADRDVRKILAISRRNNRKLDVTGCLSCSGRHFAQILEGREDAIEPLRKRIAADPRHGGFQLLVDRTIVLREHPRWSMAYLHNVNLVDVFEALLSGPRPNVREALVTMARLKPDTVMGAL